MITLTNELLFIIQTALVSSFALGALKLGKEALISFVALSCVLANLFVTKQILLCGLGATASDAFTIGSVLGLNLLQEYYGKEITKKSIWINFLVLIFYTIMTQMHLVYIPSTCDTMQPHFNAILAAMPRIAIASLSVYLVVQYVDYILYGFLKKYFENRYLVGRNYLSIIFCQLLDTVLFSLLGLYGIVENIGHIILVSYCVKLIAIAIATPCVGISKKIME